MNDLRITERTVRRSDCPECGSTFDHVTGFLHLDADPYATYFAACHRHPEPEVQIDVVLGTWGTGDAADHVTFSCRLRRAGAMLVDATVATDSDDPILGIRLTRAAALVHPRLSHLWDVIDHLSTADAAIRSG